MRLNLNDSFPLAANGTRGPLPKQERFFKQCMDLAGPKYVTYCGGIGCLHGDEKINTQRGPVPISQVTLLDSVLQPDGRYVRCTPAFPRGQDYLFEVVHERGQFVAAGSHLVFCADRVYRRVDEICAHSSVLAYFDSPDQTTQAFYPSEWPLDDPHYYQTILDYLGRCLAYSHQYGQLPQGAQDSVQVCLRVLSGVPGYNPLSAHADALLGLSLGSIRHDQLCDLLSNWDSYCHQVGIAFGVGDQALASPSAHSSQASPDVLLTLESLKSRLLKQLDPRSDISVLTYSKVLSVTQRTVKETYWDLSIPGPECYLAGGLLHHNSGKTLIGCLTVLSWAVVYGGDYLIGRQYFPELKVTTLKTFLEITPPELVLEHRVADGIVRIKSASGKPANVIFRQLEEPDKLRSLNLSGVYIDEASQVTEAAFMLLQGRLRGHGPRKLIMTTNPAGHDWIHRWFVKQDHFKNPETKKQFSIIKAPSTENVHLPEGYIQTIMETWSEERIRREIYGDMDSFEGQVYSEFRQDLHVIEPFKIPMEWTRYVGADHGYRNPAAFIWGAVDYDGSIFIYREFYESEWLIEEICKGKQVGDKLAPGINQLCKGERIEEIRIDPSTKARRGTGLSDFEAYSEHLLSGIPLLLANNTKSAGIDRVKGYFKPHPKTGKPRIYIFDTCKNLIDEIARYRYEELPLGRQGKINEKEEPKKVDDHACDALRYLIMGQPEEPKREDNAFKLREYASLEGSLYRELQSIKHPEPKDPFGD